MSFSDLPKALDDCFDTDEKCAMEMADRMIKDEDFAFLSLGREHEEDHPPKKLGTIVGSTSSTAEGSLPLGQEVTLTHPTPKPKRHYTKRKSIAITGGGDEGRASQPLGSLDENIFNSQLSSPAIANALLSVFQSASCPPHPPQKRRSDPGVLAAAATLQSIGVAKGRRGRGGRGPERPTIPRPLWVGNDENCLRVGEGSVVKPEFDGYGHLDDASQSFKEVKPSINVETTLIPALRDCLPASPDLEVIEHRPVTRSLSTTTKVLVSVDNFQDATKLQLSHPRAQYVTGVLFGEYFCPVLKKRMVRVTLKGFEEPQDFFFHSVHVFPPAPLSPVVDYSSPCVCCLPDGEAKLASDSETEDENYNCNADVIMDQEMEDDTNWDDVVPEDPDDLKRSKEYFRYSNTLPFQSKYHDIHWHRDYKGDFGTERSWEGGDEIGVPLIEKTSCPLKILNHFITKETWVRIVRQTNLYAKQKGRKDWTPLTVVEFRCWLGICVFMGILRLPELRMYWKQDHPVFRNNFIPYLMARDRWLDIMACVHLVDNTKVKKDKTDPAYHKIAKVRWLIESICDRFWKMKPVDRFLSIDEMMIRCLSKYCPIKQYNKDKPIPHGIKVWALVSTSTKYIYHLDIYCGAQVGPVQAPVRQPSTPALEDRATYKVVMKLMSHVPSGVGHVVTMDNFFTTVKIFADLLDRKIYATGTARPGMVGWPSSMGWDKKLKGSRGELRWRMHSSLELGACVWYDKRPVGILSSYARPWAEDTWVDRKEGGNIVSYPTASSLLSYVKLMRGVDVADQLRGGYTISRKGCRWRKRGLFFIFDSAFCNSYVVGKQFWEGTPRESHPFPTHVAFNIALGDALVRDWARMRGLGPEFVDREMGRADGTAHGPVWTNSLRQNCKICGKRSRWMCDTCPGQPFICIARGKRCYQIFHQKMKYLV